MPCKCINLNCHRVCKLAHSVFPQLRANGANTDSSDAAVDVPSRVELHRPGYVHAPWLWRHVPSPVARVAAAVPPDQGQFSAPRPRPRVGAGCVPAPSLLRSLGRLGRPHSFPISAVWSGVGAVLCPVKCRDSLT